MKSLLCLLICALLSVRQAVVGDSRVDEANQAAADGNLASLKQLAAQSLPMLPTTYGANWAAGTGQLPVLEWLAAQSPPILPNVEGANGVAMNGELPMLKWLAAQSPPILPNAEGANWAVHDRKLPMLKWLAAQSPPVLPTVEGANGAAAYGHLRVLEWLAAQSPPIFPNVEGANRAVKNEQLPVLEWLAAQSPPILPSVEGANWAAGNGKLPMLEWLAAQSPPILPNIEGANRAVASGEFPVLKWLTAQSPPILPNADGINWAVYDRQLPMLKWLAAQSPPVLPNVEGANRAAGSGELLVLEWLAAQSPSILPNVEGANQAARSGHLPALEWLAAQSPSILPSTSGANRAAGNGELPVLKWLAAKSPPILPSTYGANWAAGSEKLPVLEWLAAQSPHILPNAEGANWAAGNGKLPVLKWLAAQSPSILPTVEGVNQAAGNGQWLVLEWLAAQSPPILSTVWCANGVRYACQPLAVYDAPPKSVALYYQLIYRRPSGFKPNTQHPGKQESDMELGLARMTWEWIGMQGGLFDQSQVAGNRRPSSPDELYRDVLAHFDASLVLADLEKEKSALLETDRWPRELLTVEVRTCKPSSTSHTRTLIVLADTLVYELDYDLSNPVCYTDTSCDAYPSTFRKSAYADYVSKNPDCFFPLDTTVTADSLRKATLDAASQSSSELRTELPTVSAILSQGLLDRHPLLPRLMEIATDPAGWERVDPESKRGFLGVGNTIYFYIKPEKEDIIGIDELVYNLSALCGMSGSFVMSAGIVLNGTPFTLSEYAGILPVKCPSKDIESIPAEHLNAMNTLMSAGTNVWATMNSLMQSKQAFRMLSCPLWSEHLLHLRALYDNMAPIDFENVSLMSLLMGGGDLHDWNYIVQYDPVAQRLRVKNIDYGLYFSAKNFLVSGDKSSLPEHPAFHRPLINMTDTIRRLESIDAHACQQLLKQPLGTRQSCSPRCDLDFGKRLQTMMQVLKSHEHATLLQLNVLLRDALSVL